MSLLTGCLSVVLAATTVLPGDPPTVGEAFPLLAFPSLEDGSLQTMAEFRGTKVLLIQFASW